MTQESQKHIHTYNGELTFDIIENILQLSKKKLDAMNLELIVKKRVYAVLVECLENTYKHNDGILPKDSKHYQVELNLIKQNDCFIVDISNYVSKQNLDELKHRIDKVNSLDLNKLNQLYRASISKARISDKGGAGLGIIEIARNSRQKIKYNIIRESGDTIHFNLRIQIADKVKTKC